MHQVFPDPASRSLPCRPSTELTVPDPLSSPPFPAMWRVLADSSGSSSVHEFTIAARATLLFASKSCQVHASFPPEQSSRSQMPRVPQALQSTGRMVKRGAGLPGQQPTVGYSCSSQQQSQSWSHPLLNLPKGAQELLFQFRAGRKTPAGLWGRDRVWPTLANTDLRPHPHH